MDTFGSLVSEMKVINNEKGLETSQEVCPQSRVRLDCVILHDLSKKLAKKSVSRTD